MQNMQNSEPLRGYILRLMQNILVVEPIHKIVKGIFTFSFVSNNVLFYTKGDRIFWIDSEDLLDKEEKKFYSDYK